MQPIAAHCCYSRIGTGTYGTVLCIYPALISELQTANRFACNQRLQLLAARNQTTAQNDLLARRAIRGETDLGLMALMGGHRS